MALILSPFSWLLSALNGVFDSYGIAIIFFAVVVKILLFPFAIKGKRGMIQMNMLSGQMQQIKKQYGKDQVKYNQAIQELYAKEQVNPMSGCLWTLLPLFILLPLYAVIRQPLFYIAGLSELQVLELANLLQWDTLAVELGLVTQEMIEKGLAANVKDGFAITSGFTNDMYNQLYLAGLLPQEGLTLADGTHILHTNFHMFGLDLTHIPTLKLWEDFSIGNLGSIVLVVISACTGIVFSKITQKTNKMSQNQQQTAQMEQTNKMMMYTMPIMSLWIGFIMPSIMVIYWIANNLLSMVQELVAGQLLKKDYEAARLAAEKRELLEKEEEKRKKEEKSKEIAQRQLENKQNKGKKKKKVDLTKDDTEEHIDKTASREGLRTYARGRSYDPNRYPDPNLVAEENQPTDVTKTLDPAEPSSSPKKELEAEVLAETVDATQEKGETPPENTENQEDPQGAAPSAEEEEDQNQESLQEQESPNPGDSEDN